MQNINFKLGRGVQNGVSTVFPLCWKTQCHAQQRKETDHVLYSSVIPDVVQ